ncbi:MAG: hypothetical protein ABSF70_08495 [Terracidiphilus sp.]
MLSVSIFGSVTDLQSDIERESVFHVLAMYARMLASFAERGDCAAAAKQASERMTAIARFRVMVNACTQKP